MMPTASIAKRAPDLQAFRISPADSNYFACLLDPLADGVSFTLVVEIFEPGGKTPPNTHAVAEEAFFVMAGTGKALAEWRHPRNRSGRRLVLRPGVEHVVENTGPGKTLLPDDDDAERGLRRTDPRRHPGGTHGRGPSGDHGRASDKSVNYCRARSGHQNRRPFEPPGPEIGEGLVGLAKRIRSWSW